MPSMSSQSHAALHTAPSFLLLLLHLLGLLVTSSCGALSSPVPRSPRPSSSSAAGPNLTVTVDVSTLPSLPYLSQAVPGNFLGLSLEWPNPLHFIGPNVSAPHHSFYTILPYLSTRQGRGPILRIGGSSSDRSWYNPTGLPAPQWSDFVANITDDTYTVLERMSSALNLSIIAGVSFRYPYSMNITGPEVEAMLRVVGKEGWASGRWSIEVGNEQDIMDACGAHPYEDYRPCGWGWNNFTVVTTHTHTLSTLHSRSHMWTLTLCSCAVCVCVCVCRSTTGA
jgi:hypothetical protein